MIFSPNTTTSKKVCEMSDLIHPKLKKIIPPFKTIHQEIRYDLMQRYKGKTLGHVVVSLESSGRTEYCVRLTFVHESKTIIRDFFAHFGNDFELIMESEHKIGKPRELVTEDISQKHALGAIELVNQFFLERDYE